MILSIPGSKSLLWKKFQFRVGWLNYPKDKRAAAEQKSGSSMARLFHPDAFCARSVNSKMGFPPQKMNIFAPGES
jgi:hypothetical protein